MNPIILIFTQLAASALRDFASALERGEIHLFPNSESLPDTARRKRKTSRKNAESQKSEDGTPSTNTALPPTSPATTTATGNGPKQSSHGAPLPTKPNNPAF